MVQILYEIPLPNDGENYKFTKQELEDLLQKIFESGCDYIKKSLDKEIYTYTSFTPRIIEKDIKFPSRDISVFQNKVFTNINNEDI